MINVVGHFGSTFSYATVASALARRLRRDGLLGRVINLDDRWAPAHRDLAAESTHGTHVIVMSTPRHYFDAFVTEYGRDRSAIFACPNTDNLSKEYAETCAKFGVAIVPSTWCEDTVRLCSSPGEIVRLALGVEDIYVDLDVKEGASSNRVYHFSTDQWWPGRKGTEELLEAWKLALKRNLFERAYTLHLHVPQALESTVQYKLADLGLMRSVVVEVAEERGSTDAALAECMAKAVAVVQPSRCEGFGMMFLAALVAGVPLIATPVTGQRDFMLTTPGWLGVPIGGLDPVASEEGLAPSIDPEALALTLATGLSDHGLWVMRRGNSESRSVAPKWTWNAVLDSWVEWARQWLKETA
jgi:glycosyltransferase involved in cell wall biosynthesis